MADQARSKAPLFTVSNKHAADSGPPPRIDGDAENLYHGYFENTYGEQAVFVFDDQTGTGTLWMGDAGWEQSYPVVDGAAPDLNLDEAEALWLRSCWLAASGRTAHEG